MDGIKDFCRGCRSTDLLSVINLGLLPLPNENGEGAETFPLEMMYCPQCHNCQLSYVVPRYRVYNNFSYTSSSTEVIKAYLEQTARQYINEFNLTPDSFVIDIGSNDGTFLKVFKDNGIKVLGIEPAGDIAQIAIDKNIDTVVDVFTDESTKDIALYTVDLITGFNTFAHSDILEEMIHRAIKLLKDNGTLIIETPYILDTIKNLAFNNITHEQTNYWSVTSLVNFITRIGYHLCKVEYSNVRGSGFIKVHIKKTGDVIDSSVATYLLNEETFGLKDYNTYLTFAQQHTV